MSANAQSNPVPQQRPQEEPGAPMSFFDHLIELRKRLISALAAVGIGMVLGLIVSKQGLNYIFQPMVEALKRNHQDPNLYFTHPAGYVMLYINFGLYLGIALAMPWVLYQIWLFVAPGLYKHERKAVAGFIISATGLFLCGVAFAYYVMLPQVLTFVVEFSNTGPVRPWIDINECFNLVLIVLLGLGIIFELPVVIFILSIFGIVTPKFLMKNFRYAMLIIAVVAAVVTPTPDATTMMIFMAPMVLLYLAGVVVSYAVVRRKKARALAEGQAS